MANNGTNGPLHPPQILSPTAFDGIAFAFLSVALATTLARVYVHCFVVRAFGLDDFLIVVGSVSTSPESCQMDITKC